MGKKILVADDSLIIRAGLKQMFEKSSEWDEVILAENGQIAVETVLREKPDAVCMDVEMPVKDGITALKEMTVLRKQGKINPHMPVIILSATLYKNEEQARKLKLYGAAAVMAKPEGKSSTVMIDFKTLEETILKAIAFD